MKQNKYIVYLIFAFLLLLSNTSAAEPAWELVSMTPPRGSVWNFAFNKNNDIFASSDNGLYCSTNYGQSWNWILSDRVANIIVCENGSLLAQRTVKLGPNYFWNVYSIFSSIDNGNSWNEIKKFWLTNENQFNMKIHKSKILCSFYKDFNEQQMSYYLSYDCANNWIKVGNLDVTCFLQNQFDFFDSTIIQIGYGFYDGYICKSSDLGKNWNIQRFKNNLINDIYIKSPQEIYVLTYNGVYLSKDTCNSMELKWLPGNKILSCKFQGEDTIFITTKSGLYYSYNNGKDWLLSNSFNDINLGYNILNWIIENDFNNNLFTSPLIYGIYSSFDHGINWTESNNGFTGWQINDLIFDKTSKAYSTSWGIYRSDSSLKNWKDLGLKSIDLGMIAVNSKGDIFITAEGTGNSLSGIFRSKDYGKTWDNFFNGAPVVTIVINNNDKILIADGSGNVFRSTDNGETWEFPTNVTGRKLGINDEGHIFSFGGGMIYKSTDEGGSWDKIAITMLDPTYTETEGRIIFNKKTKTAAYYDIVTTDNGRTWKKQSNSNQNLFPHGTTESRYYAIDSSFNWIYAGDGNYWPEKNLLRSTDNGRTWQKMDTTGLNTRLFQTIGCSPDGHIYVFGSTGGLYRSRDAFVSVSQKVMDNIYNVSISPNPAKTKIKLDIPIYNPSDFMLFHQNEIIQVYDILGACVLQVKPDLENAIYNDNQIELDISTLATGTYYLRYGRYSQHFVKCSN